MTENLVLGWSSVYPHLHYEDPGEAVTWLTRVFGFRELVRMARPDGTVIVSKLESARGGLVMVGGRSPERAEWIRQRVPDFREQQTVPWPDLSHAVTVIVDDVDAHHERARAAGATILTVPTDQPWGLRSYAAIDPEGHQWEFSQTLGAVEPEAWGARRIGERVRIRDATASEAGALEALQRRSSDVWEQYRQQLAANPDAIELPQSFIENSWVRVAVAGEDAPIGFSVVIPSAGAVHQLDGLFVEPAHMQRGVGRALVEDAAGGASARGARCLEVTAGPAQGFYERVGFSVTASGDTRFGPAERMRRELTERPEII